MRRLFLALGAISLLACGDSTGVGAASAVGTWNLVTVNGDPVPSIVLDIANPPFRVEIVSDQIILDEDGTYTETSLTRETESGTVTDFPDFDTGIWSQTGRNLTVTASDGSVTHPTISGNDITLNEGGLVAVWHRQ